MSEHTRATPDLPLFETQTSESQTLDKPGSRNNALSVDELTQAVKAKLEPGFRNIWVQGELSNLRPSQAGHMYFTLKDESASISGAFFGWHRNAASKKFKLQDGMEVLCHGKISVYGPRGTYQLVTDQIEPLGAGALQLAFEQLKEKLRKAGYFDSERKKKLPAFPKRVCIVTSASGAALQDFCKVLKTRAPSIQIRVFPTLVQGDGAGTSIARCLRIANEKRLGDVVVLSRGGGSIEDLWCFNDEDLAQAIFESEIPVVSAVGHEIDFTISDFVSDYRAPTPSAAAEVLSLGWVKVEQRVATARERLILAFKRVRTSAWEKLRRLHALLVSPRDRLREQFQRCDEWDFRQKRAMEVRLQRSKDQMRLWAEKLNALSPLSVLERGYAIVRDPKNQGKILGSAEQAKVGQKLGIRFYDGEISVQVESGSTVRR